MQNCNFKNVIGHLFEYKTGNNIVNAMHDCKKQHPQLIIINIGRVEICGVDA